MNSLSATNNIHFLLLLIAGVFATSLGLIATSHDCRAKYSILQNLELQGWSLQEDHTRLLLEHSTWSSYDRVEEVATKKLLMKIPNLDGLVLIRE